MTAIIFVVRGMSASAQENHQLVGYKTPSEPRFPFIFCFEKQFILLLSHI